MHELMSNRGASGEIRTARRAQAAEVSGHESGRLRAFDMHHAPVLTPRRSEQLRSNSSRLRPHPTNGLSEQSSDAESHGNDQSEAGRCVEQRASNADLQATDRNPLPQLIDGDREQRPAHETPATDRVGDRQSDTRKPSAQHCGHSSEADDRNDHIENRDPLVVLHQAKPPSEGQQPSSRDSGRERHLEFDSMSPIAKVAHASRVGGVDREPALRTTARHRAPQRLQTTAAAEMQGMHIACTRRIGGSGLGRSGFSAFHGDAFSSRFVRRELYRAMAARTPPFHDPPPRTRRRPAGQPRPARGDDRRRAAAAVPGGRRRRGALSLKSLIRLQGPH